MRSDGGDYDGANFKCKTRCNDTHASTTDPDARLYLKGDTASELRLTANPSAITATAWCPARWSLQPTAMPTAKRPTR